MRIQCRRQRWFSGTVLILVLTASARAEVQPNHLFTDHAVLQRGKPVPVWGSGTDGETVTVRFAGQEVSTEVKDGRWMVTLEPMDACADGETLTITCGDQTIEVKDVLVGEVWIASGQSNMQWSVAASDEPEKVLASDAAKDPLLRLITVPRKPADEPRDDFDANWLTASPESVKDFSAVAFYFGRELREALGVPIGLISTNVGGTPAEAWTSREFLAAEPKLEGLVDRKNERSPTHSSSGLYNAMIAPLVPYAIQGAIWYQGESNASRYEEYRTLFPTMIASWRKAWNQGDFPFLFVQLAPFGPPDEDAWAGLREAQLLTLDASPNTAMAVITDYGAEDDIHPKRKEPVGERLALAARVLAYGEKLVYSGPIFESMRVNGDRAILRFEHVGGGLKADGKALKGFEIAGSDGTFVPATARIRRDKRTVVVRAEGVDKPTAVRYGWDSYPVVNLYNEEGLPASPFRTNMPNGK